MRKLLVTGGCGFIGTNFIRKQMETPGVQVLNFDAVTYCGRPANLEDLPADRYRLMRADICDREAVARALADFRPEAVVHFAAESHVDRSISSAEPFFRTNVMGTLNLMERSLGYWSSLSAAEREKFRFLHISTDEVFGSLGLKDPEFTEESNYAPNSPYAASKAGSDQVARVFFKTHGLPVLITNCSNNYGPYQYPEKLIPFFIKKALRGESLPIYGDGQNRRDWLYVEDHCEAVACVLEKARPGARYNIGGGLELSNLEMTKTICSKLDAARPRKTGSYFDLATFVTDRLGHDFRYAINHDKLTRDLGWKPRFSFENALEKTLSWYLASTDFLESPAKI